MINYPESFETPGTFLTHHPFDLTSILGLAGEGVKKNKLSEYNARTVLGNILFSFLTKLLGCLKPPKYS